MTIFLITLAAFGLAVSAMAVGVIFSNRCIKGTCGGLNQRFGGTGCEACGSCEREDPAGAEAESAA